MIMFTNHVQCLHLGSDYSGHDSVIHITPFTADTTVREGRREKRGEPNTPALSYPVKYLLSDF